MFMNLKYLLIGILAFTFACSSSGTSRKKELQRWKEPNGKVKVLSTIAMINDMVKSIGAEDVDTLTLVEGELDPHSYQLVKGDDEKLTSADLIFYNGLGLEHGPSLQYHLNRNPKAVGLGNNLQHDMPERILNYNGQLDPHIWTDISLWSETIPFIVNALSKQDPAHASDYRKRGTQLQFDLEQAHREIQHQMLSIPENQRYFVTSHDAFNYFTRAYLATDQERRNNTWQKRFAAPEGLSPESQLSSADIQAIINHLRNYNIHILFPESNVSKDSIRKIIAAGKEKGLDLQIAEVSLYADAMGAPGSDGDTYLKMMKHNADTLRKWLLKVNNN